MIPKTITEVKQILRDKNIENDLERAKDLKVDFEEVKENKL
jgi:hypothetical protein